MSTPTLIRLGVLRTQARDYYDAGEQLAGIQIHTIDGTTIRMDRDGADAPLYPGTGYEIRPNDGWAVDRDIDGGAGHFAHLVDDEGRPATELPLIDGAMALDRSRQYLVRFEHGAWVIYDACA